MLLDDEAERPDGATVGVHDQTAPQSARSLRIFWYLVSLAVAMSSLQLEVSRVGTGNHGR